MSLQDGVYRQFLEGKNTDFTITCGGREFKVHRVVLCAQSKFFARMCEGDFKEAQERAVDLPEDDPEILEPFLSYMYTGEYADGLYSRSGNPSPASLLSFDKTKFYLADIGIFIDDHAQKEPHDSVYPTEENHNIKGTCDFKDCCGDVQCLIPRFTQSLNTSVKLYIMANKFEAGGLILLTCQRFWVTVKELLKINHSWHSGDGIHGDDENYDHIAAAISKLYDNTSPCDKGMRVVICAMLSQNFDDGGLMDSLEVVSVMEKHREVFMLISALRFRPRIE